MTTSALRSVDLSSDPITLPPIPPWKARLHTKLNRLACSPRIHRLFAVSLLLGVPGLGAYAHLIEPTWLRVRRLTLPVQNLPLALDGFRIVHLSDLHMGSLVPHWFLRKTIRTACALAPDLIVLTGDFVHTRPEDGSSLTTLLGELQAPSGVFAVLGNHDYAVNYPGDRGMPGVETSVIRALEKAGVTVLRNEWVALCSGKTPLAPLGIDELLSGRARVSPLHTIPSPYPRVVLCHNPDVVPFLPPNSFDLLLCGHTHGGQVRLPLLPPPITATHNRRFWGGLFPQGRGWVFVSRGIGYTWQVRVAARPE